MNDLQIFSNEEFGQVRTVTINEEVWFVGKDVADILEYTNTAKAIRDHIDEEDKLTERIVLSGQNREVIFINESGLYSLILSSKMSNARKFKRWVTSEVLPTLHKTGHYEMESYSPEMQAILMHDKKLVKMDERVTTLENTMTIDYAQQQALKETVNYIVVDALGGKGSEAYREISKKVFSECNRDIQRYFHVNSRNNVPKKRFDDAIEYVQHWQPCVNTQIAIKECNSQLRFA